MKPQNVNTNFWKKKKPNRSAGSGKGRTPRLMLAQQCHSGEETPCNPQPQQAAGENLCKPLTPHSQEPTRGFLIPQSLFCPLSPHNGCEGLCRKGAMWTFSQLISELILSSAGIFYRQQGSSLQSNAMHTPLKNDAFKPALWCSKFESALNNNKDQH